MGGSINFHPVPGSHAMPVYITCARRPLDALRACLASDMDRHENDFDVYSEEDSVLLDGEVIGSVEFP